MRKIIILLLIASAFLLGCPKKDPYKLRKPESVVWNPVTKSYLISNAGTGIILSLIDKYKFDVFNKFKLISPKGMAIGGTNLYVADVYRVVGLDLKTGRKTYLHSFPKTSFLNDVATSPDGRVFVSDTNNNLIIILTPATDKVDIVRNALLQGPNGLYYVKQDGRDLLYIVSFKNDGFIQVMDLQTRKITPVPGTEISLADGITRNPEGSWLVSSWADSTIYEFSPDFSVRKKISDKYSSPADIFYSIDNDELAVPHFQTNQISFVTHIKSAQPDSTKQTPAPER